MASGRRTLGFLFADLRGYTRFIDEHGDAAAGALVRDYRAIVREIVDRHGGTEQSTEGDSFFVVFDSVSAAVLCGIEVLGAAGGHDPPIRLGVGVHAGEASAGESGYVAGAVNLAARLCAAAKAGDILVTDTVRGLTRTAVEARFQSLGAKRLKGFEEPVALWRIEVPGAARAVEDDRPPRALSWPVLAALLVGLAFVAGDLYGIRSPPIVGWFQVFIPAAPLIVLIDLGVTAAILLRLPTSAQVSARALVGAGLVAALLTPWLIVGILQYSQATPLGEALIGGFGAAVIALSLAMAYGLWRRRPWVVGVTYVVCAILLLTAYGLQPVAVAGAWAVRSRRENSLF